MSRVRLAVLALSVAMAAGALLAAPSASARPAAPLSTAGLHARIGLGAGPAPAVPTTYYGAGYFTYPGAASGPASAQVTFKMPSFSCKRTDDHEWLLPGIWVYDGSGNLSEQVDVNFNCNLGAKLQEGVICISGGSCDTSLVVTPGNRIQASIAYTSTATIGTLHNLTRGTSTQVVGPAITTDYTVFIGDEGPSLFSVNNVPTFKSVAFSVGYVNGQSIAAWSGVRYYLKTTTAVQILTGLLSGDGDAFNTTFKHN